MNTSPGAEVTFDENVTLRRWIRVDVRPASFCRQCRRKTFFFVADKKARAYVPLNLFWSSLIYAVRQELTTKLGRCKVIPFQILD